MKKASNSLFLNKNLYNSRSPPSLLISPYRREVQEELVTPDVPYALGPEFEDNRKLETLLFKRDDSVKQRFNFYSLSFLKKEKKIKYKLSLLEKHF